MKDSLYCFQLSLSIIISLHNFTTLKLSPFLIYSAMADITKYESINNGGTSLISDFKSHFSFRRTKKSVSLAYGFIFIFIAFTTFLAFIPSSNSSSPWFTYILSTTTITTTTSSIYDYNNYPNSSSSSRSHDVGSQNTSLLPPNVTNQSNDGEKTSKNDVFMPNNGTHLPQTVNSDKNPLKSSSGLSKGSSDLNKNQNQSENSDNKVGVLKGNQSTSGVKNVTADGEKAILKNLTYPVTKKHENVAMMKQGIDDLIKPLMNCDLFDGNWIRDESYPLYKPGSCSLIDEQFNCFLSGRPDNGYHKLKWKPKGCTLPRLDGSHMLELLRGKRLVFVGDSLNRNMWESLICILKNSVKDQKKVYEQSGRYQFRTEASFSFVFEEYKSTVEFFTSPFLVQEWEATDKNGTKKETLRLDLIGNLADKYKSADMIVFNTGHWWTHEKTSLGKDYYQEGSHVYSELNVLEAFRKALTTWGRWVDANFNPMKSLVFFRGYSNSHFSGGQWNSGGQCDNETEPITNDKYLTEYPPKMMVLERVLRRMKTHVTYLNVTKMTDYRKDAHPSVYRKQHYTDEEKRSPLAFQDCSHWCLPGVPDAWNEILYAELLIKLNNKQQKLQ